MVVAKEVMARFDSAQRLLWDSIGYSHLYLWLQLHVLTTIASCLRAMLCVDVMLRCSESSCGFASPLARFC